MNKTNIYAPIVNLWLGNLKLYTKISKIFISRRARKRCSLKVRKNFIANSFKNQNIYRSFLLRKQMIAKTLTQTFRDRASAQLIVKKFNKVCTTRRKNSYISRSNNEKLTLIYQKNIKKLINMFNVNQHNTQIISVVAMYIVNRYLKRLLNNFDNHIVNDKYNFFKSKSFLLLNNNIIHNRLQQHKSFIKFLTVTTLINDNFFILLGKIFKHCRLKIKKLHTYNQQSTFYLKKSQHKFFNYYLVNKIRRKKKLSSTSNKFVNSIYKLPMLNDSLQDFFPLYLKLFSSMYKHNLNKSLNNISKSITNYVIGSKDKFTQSIKNKKPVIFSKKILLKDKLYLKDSLNLGYNSLKRSTWAATASKLNIRYRKFRRTKWINRSFFVISGYSFLGSELDTRLLYRQSWLVNFTKSDNLVIESHRGLPNNLIFPSVVVARRVVKQIV